MISADPGSVWPITSTTLPCSSCRPPPRSISWLFALRHQREFTAVARIADVVFASMARNPSRNNRRIEPRHYRRRCRSAAVPSPSDLLNIAVVLTLNIHTACRRHGLPGKVNVVVVWDRRTMIGSRFSGSTRSGGASTLVFVISAPLPVTESALPLGQLNCSLPRCHVPRLR